MNGDVLKLRVDSQEYDSKIKRAREGLLAMEQACHKIGGTLAVLEPEEKKFIESLGKMETVSKTAKGKLSELTAAFTDLSSQYRRLTDEEKKGAFGQALQKSLGELKVRIKDAKTELSDIQGEISGNSTLLDTLAGKFGLSAKELMSFGTKLGAGKLALDVVKDAFFANEQSLDEWGRTVESSSAIYDSFLKSINTGDISGFLGNIDKIVRAAREAYDALDELGTFNAFNKPNEIRARQGMMDAMNDFREGSGTKQDVQKAADRYMNEIRKRQRLETSAYQAKINEVAAKNGVDPAQLLKIMTGDYDSYKAAKSVQMTGERRNTISGGNSGYKQTIVTKYARTEEEKMGEALRAFNDTELKAVQELAANSEQTGIEIEQIRRQVSRTINTKTKGSTPKGSSPTFKSDLSGITDIKGITFDGTITSTKALEEELRKLKAAFADATDPFTRFDLQMQIVEKTKEVDQRKIADSIFGKEFAEKVKANIEGSLKDFKLLPVTSTTIDNVKELKDTAGGISQVFSSASTAVGQFAGESEAAARASQMFSIAGAVAQLIAQFAEVNKGVEIYSWIAGTIAGAATLASTVASLKNIETQYHADGGMVGTTPFIPRGTDTVPAMLTPGEIVLNAAQQRNMANNLQGTNLMAQGGMFKMELLGDKLISVINNTLTLQGKKKIG